VVTPEDFQIAMRPLMRRFKQEQPESAEDWNDYYQILKHFPVEALAAAALKVLAEHVYPTFPKPAVILQAAAAVCATPQKSGMEAWGRVLYAAVRYGYDNPPRPAGATSGWTFSDPLTLEAVNAIGWAYICQSEEEMVMRAHFIKCYEQMRDRAAVAARELPAVAAVRAQLTAGRREQAAQLMAGIGVAK
jgi:hypothetical protein